MRVKICGITREEDARLAVSLGAHAIGFIFWPRSPRFIEPSRARTIVAGLPPLVTAVGVFVNEPADRVNEIADEAGLAAVQLHGDETPEYVRSIARPAVKAIGVGPDFVASSADAWPEHVLLLLDVHDQRARGGTGRTIDWSVAERIARQRPVLLAGGLNPANAADAIRSVRPYGIDVSSGVEASPGIKDPERLRALFDVVGDHAHSPSATRS